MEGRGKFFFENGNVYEGEFLNNQFHGQGTITFPGSGKYEATWVFGKARSARSHAQPQSNHGNCLCRVASRASRTDRLLQTQTPARQVLLGGGGAGSGVF